VVADAEANLLRGGGGGGHGSKTFLTNPSKTTRKNEMARPREEEWRCSREREKDESEKEINAQKALKTGDTRAVVCGNRARIPHKGRRPCISLQNNV